MRDPIQKTSSKTFLARFHKLIEENKDDKKLEEFYFKAFELNNKLSKLDGQELITEYQKISNTDTGIDPEFKTAMGYQSHFINKIFSFWRSSIIKQRINETLFILAENLDIDSLELSTRVKNTLISLEKLNNELKDLSPNEKNTILAILDFKENCASFENFCDKCINTSTLSLSLLSDNDITKAIKIKNSLDILNYELNEKFNFDSILQNIDFALLYASDNPALLEYFSNDKNLETFGVQKIEKRNFAYAVRDNWPLFEENWDVAKEHRTLKQQLQGLRLRRIESQDPAEQEVLELLISTKEIQQNNIFNIKALRKKTVSSIPEYANSRDERTCEEHYVNTVQNFYNMIGLEQKGNYIMDSTGKLNPVVGRKIKEYILDQYFLQLQEGSISLT